MTTCFYVMSWDENGLCGETLCERGLRFTYRLQLSYFSKESIFEIQLNYGKIV